jgi:putative hydrolase of the HAD superfamily
VDAAVSSGVHGKTKPHPTIFLAALERLAVAPAEAVMIGDSVGDDIEGARSVGMRALLIDRENRYPDVEEKLTDLRALPAALGLGHN